jgi:hypothetical protein
LAARFPDRQRASAALDALQERLQLPADAAAIAPLGRPGEGSVGDETLLAGHFADNQTGLVRSLVTRSGGEVVADVDEQWTRPDQQPIPAPTPTRRGSREPSAAQRRRASGAPRQTIAQ